MNKKLETTNCVICKTNKYTILFENHDRLHGKDGIFNVVQCNSCGLIYLNPRPMENYIGDYYPDIYEPYNTSLENFYIKLHLSLLTSYYRNKKNFADYFKSILCQMLFNPIPIKYKGTRILDIGCGNGVFLYGLKNNDFDVYGIDMSEKAVDFAQNTLGLNNVKLSSINKLEYQDEFFDVITMNHVIEHLYNPENVIKEIDRILKKDGLLVISTPNSDSINFKLFKEYWFPLETPRHLNLFNHSTIQKLLCDFDFIIDKISFDVSTYSIAQSFKYKFRFNLGIIRLLLLPIMYLISIFNKGDIIVFKIKRRI